MKQRKSRNNCCLTASLSHNPITIILSRSRSCVVIWAAGIERKPNKLRVSTRRRVIWVTDEETTQLWIRSAGETVGVSNTEPPQEKDVRYNKYKSVRFLSPFTSLIIKPGVITTVGLIKFLRAARREDRQPLQLKRALSESLRPAIISLHQHNNTTINNWLPFLPVASAEIISHKY